MYGSPGKDRTGRQAQLQSPSPGPDHLYFLYHPDHQSSHGRRRGRRSGLCHERQLHPDLGRVYFSFPDPGLKRAGPPGFCQRSQAQKRVSALFQGGPQSHPLYPQPSPGKDLSSPVSPGLGAEQRKIFPPFQRRNGDESYGCSQQYHQGCVLAYPSVYIHV